MTLASDLRAIVSAARPTVEEWIDIGEQFTAFREACKAKGLDWGQIKALLKAQVLDERDGGERVAKIVEKAEFASSYAAMLGLLPADMNEENNSETSLGRSPAAPPPPPAVGAKTVPAPIRAGSHGASDQCVEGPDKPKALYAQGTAAAVASAAAPIQRAARDDDLGIPPGLRRERNANDDAAVAAIMGRLA